MSITVQTADQAPALASKFGLPISDYCRTLFTRLEVESTSSARPIHTLGLTSCTQGEGVTTVAAQLATIGACSLGTPVVLVDCNLGDPSVHRVFDVPIGRGLRDALSETESTCEFLQRSAVANLSLLTAGRHVPGASLAFNAPQLDCVLEELKQEFRLVVVDLPPIANGAPAGIERLLDGLLLVVESEKVRWEVAQWTSGALAEMGANLLGVVMNKRSYHVPTWLYKTL